MLTPTELVSAAAAIFAVPKSFEAAKAARAATLDITPVAAVANAAWRMMYQETSPASEPGAVSPGALALPPPPALTSVVWAADQVRLFGRRGLVGRGGALFLGGPVRDAADLARAVADCAEGAEGLMLRAKSDLAADMLASYPHGDRRLAGVGLHVGRPLAVSPRPFMLGQFAALLLVADLAPRLDYVVLADAHPGLAAILSEIGLGHLKIFDLERLQGVQCAEIFVPQMAEDPAGWVDQATVARLQRFAARAHARLGRGMHADPIKIFLTDTDDNSSPLASLAVQQGYQLRGLAGRSLIDRALMMAKASIVVTDQAEGTMTTLFAPKHVPVLDLAGGDPMPRVLQLAATGRPYRFALPGQAEEAIKELLFETSEAA